MTRSKTKKVKISPVSETTPVLLLLTTAAIVLPSSSIIDFSTDRIRNEQMNDIDIQTRIQQINDAPHKYLNDIVDQQLLYKLVTRNGHTKIKLPWIPILMIPDILSAYHDHPLSGHFGVNRTYNKIKDKFYWFQMLNTIKQYVRSCTQCAQFNVQRQKKPGLLQKEPPPEGVFEIMQMDFWTAPIRSSDGNQYVLIITDKLSKYVFARALSSEHAKDAAEMLYEDIILKHGAIQCIQSDQGSHFKNELLSAITKLTGCKQIFSIPYHPMSNGQVERFNSTFCDQLKKYYHDNINDWDIYLQSVVWAYNSGIHSATGFMPYELAFNRRLISPFEFPSSEITMIKPNDYWEKANKFKKLAIHAARVNIEQQQHLGKQRYDKGRANPTYKLDDMVWIKVLSGRSKLDPRYHGPFIIMKRINEVKYIVEHAEDHYQKEEHVNNFIPFYKRN
jgi:transposase InsO family protein